MNIFYGQSEPLIISTRPTIKFPVDSLIHYYAQPLNNLHLIPPFYPHNNSRSGPIRPSLNHPFHAQYTSNTWHATARIYPFSFSFFSTSSIASMARLSPASVPITNRNLSLSSIKCSTSPRSRPKVINFLWKIINPLLHLEYAKSNH